jgi:hypothetical protein
MQPYRASVSPPCHGLSLSVLLLCGRFCVVARPCVGSGTKLSATMSCDRLGSPSRGLDSLAEPRSASVQGDRSPVASEREGGHLAPPTGGFSSISPDGSTAIPGSSLQTITRSIRSASPDHPTFPENQPLHRVVAGSVPGASQDLPRGPKPVKNRLFPRQGGPKMDRWPGS